MPVSGHCLCGAVTFHTVDEPVLIGHDHCDDCMRQTGSAYSFVVVVPTDKLTISGPVKDYAKPGASGKDVHRIFCSVCGSPIAHRPDAAKEITALKGGVLEKDQRIRLHEQAKVDIYGKDILPGVPRLENFNELMPPN